MSYEAFKKNRGKNNKHNQKHPPPVQKYNHIEIDKCDIKRIRLKLDGKNNTVIIKKLPAGKSKIHIHLFADNSTVIINENVWVSSRLDILAGQNHPNFGKIDNVKIVIGKNTSFEEAKIITFNSNSSVEIGENCMFSSGITLFNTDAHPIYDKETGNIINKVRAMKIGNHVWCGGNATILKNVQIADNCIIGWGSIVSGKFDTPDSIIAGNPAKYVRHGISWNSNGSNGYIQNE